MYLQDQLRFDRSSDYRPQMDGLRAIACLLVITIHLYVIIFPEGFILRGVPKIGVWLFFVLSAFLLTTQLLNGVSFKDYAIGRFLRIVPPFLLAVIIYRLVGTLTIDSWAKAFEVMTLQSTSGHLWTIPPELTFYLILPAIVALLAFAGNSSNCGYFFLPGTAGGGGEV